MIKQPAIYPKWWLYSLCTLYTQLNTIPYVDWFSTLNNQGPFFHCSPTDFFTKNRQKIMFWELPGETTASKKNNLAGGATWKMSFYPKYSMYGLFTYTWVVQRVDVGKYTKHWACLGVDVQWGHSPKVSGTKNWRTVRVSLTEAWHTADICKYLYFRYL